MTVITGLRAGARTTSVVNFVLYGEFGDSGIRVLSNDLKMVNTFYCYICISQNIVGFLIQGSRPFEI